VRPRGPGNEDASVAETRKNIKFNLVPRLFPLRRSVEERAWERDFIKLTKMGYSNLV
jgi:hypothetical protein